MKQFIFNLVGMLIPLWFCMFLYYVVRPFSEWLERRAATQEGQSK